MGQLDIRPGSIVLIAGFDDIPEHEFRIEEIYEEFVTRMVLSQCQEIRKSKGGQPCETG